MTRKCSVSLLLIALAMSACANPAPSRGMLRDGPMPTTAPVFVAPGYTPTGAGLPEYMPGPPEPAVERSPHKRVLPPTSEPTMFAGDGEVRAGPAPDVYVLGLPMLRPKTITTDVDAAASIECAVRINGAKDMVPNFATYFGYLTKEQQACLAALLYSQCLTKSLEREEAHKATDSAYPPGRLERVRTLAYGAAREHATRCGTQSPNAVRTKNVTDLARDVATQAHF